MHLLVMEANEKLKVTQRAMERANNLGYLLNAANHSKKKKKGICNLYSRKGTFGL